MKLHHTKEKNKNDWIYLIKKDSLPRIYYKKPAIQMLIEPKPYFDYDELRKECVR